MNYDRHPINHVLDLTKRFDDAIFEFSYYKHTPQSIFDERAIFECARNLIDENWLLDKMQNLSPKEELALHSRVRINNKTFHIPMIDFCCSVDHKAFAGKCLESVLGIKFAQGIVWFESGRSMHGYGSHLLRPIEWTQFMGRLLLANYPNSINTVDSRWVGHRIIGGYSSLRMSKNSDQYLAYPERMKY